MGRFEKSKYPPVIILFSGIIWVFGTLCTMDLPDREKKNPYRDSARNIGRKLSAAASPMVDCYMTGTIFSSFNSLIASNPVSAVISVISFHFSCSSEFPFRPAVSWLCRNIRKSLRRLPFSFCWLWKAHSRYIQTLHPHILPEQPVSCPESIHKTCFSASLPEHYTKYVWNSQRHSKKVSRQLTRGRAVARKRKIPAGIQQGWDLTGYSLSRGWVIRNEHGGVTHGSRMNNLWNNLFEIIIIICTMSATTSNGHFVVHVLEDTQGNMTANCFHLTTGSNKRLYHLNDASVLWFKKTPYQCLDKALTAEASPGSWSSAHFCRQQPQGRGRRQDSAGEHGPLFSRIYAG